VDTGFRKRSCSNNKLEREDDSKKSHPAPAPDFEELTDISDKIMREHMKIENKIATI
jgi:hypothetical protein